MRLTRLTAENVHGYLPMDVAFFPDLTFLTGLNGSGKTTALRLLMGLLTPAIDELARIEFSSAKVEVKSGEETITISAVRDADKLVINVTGAKKPLTMDAPSLEWLVDPRRREEMRSTPVFRSLQESPVYERIRGITTPMFLGLDRRLFQEERFGEPGPDAIRRREREVMMRRGYYEDLDLPSGAVGAGLAEVFMLVRDTMSEIRATQERLDRDLRERLLLSSVQFKASEFDSFEPPSRAAISRYRERQAELERAATLLRLPLSEVQQSLQDFFEKMSELSGELAAPTKVTKVGRRRGQEVSGRSRQATRALMTWLINKSQVDRILENLSLFESYASARESVHDPIDRLLDLLNKFLVQSNKKVEIASPDRLSVRLPDGRLRSVNALSSGERQLCVMLGHLILNKQLSGSGVFIVDEPELSLHISWQEMFVESVRAANPDVQLIFATHSPAIILDKEEHCRSLDGD